MEGFGDYYWHDGVPKGRGRGNSSSLYHIIADPYKKRITLEHFKEGEFVGLLYDSQLLDFRKLHPRYQTGWQRIWLEEGRR